MSALARTALRLAAVQALLADPVIAALCETRVYDSRIEDFSADDPVPVIVVLTEEMEGEAWSANNGGPPFRDECELMLEIASRAVEQAADSEAYLVTPETNAELEMQLDVLEERAVFALTLSQTPQSQLVRNAVTKRIKKQKSVRFVTADSAAKAAMRQLTLSAELKGDSQLDATELAEPIVAATAGENNTGDGVLTLGTPAFDRTVVKGNYAVAFTSATAFTVTDPRGIVRNGMVNALYARGVAFAIAIGETPWNAGDSFSLAVTQGPNAALPQPLRAVCDAMPEGSSGAGICAQIVAAYGSPRGIEFFTGADFTVSTQVKLSSCQAPLQPGMPGGPAPLDANVDIPPDAVDGGA